ncbi:ATP-binding protein [Qipengyuania sp. G39]|uniref:histidine kinase n=1 Tax=Qipengyuania profundimaris TaxID=3067652 RepID=A0ABT9HM75_9SPHN|nr:ATP-binding protein [Qipengyuania sp. G39]MDP4574251.1 ATP-binding protein [Qipengyuania sp. G39]
MASGSAKTSLLRSSSRREKVFFATVAALFALIAPLQVFAPYDWMQSIVSAHINQKPYGGDGVVVAVDDATIAATPDGEWTPEQLAALLDRIASANPAQLVVENQHLDPGETQRSDVLARALGRFTSDPIWETSLPTDDRQELSASSLPPPEVEYSKVALAGDALPGPATIPAVMPVKATFSPAPVWTVYTASAATGVYPSVTNLLADGSRPGENIFNIDVSYDPETVPLISAGSVLQGGDVRPALEGRTVVIGLVTDPRRDYVATPHDFYTPKPVITLLATETLLNGPPVYIDWLPAFLVALCGAAAWLFLTPAVGRTVLLASIICLIIAPTILEAGLIYLESSAAVVFLAVLMIGRLWQKSGHAARAYREAAESKSRFLAQASHDLRQPIHAIGLLADRLEQTQLSAQQGDMVAKISWSVDNASRMFRVLLDIAAIESGALQPDIEAVSMNELLAKIDGQNSLAAEQAGVEIRFVPCDVTVLTDRALIGTMLQNLVSNAIKYSRGGRIVVGCRRVRGRMAIHVVDTGKGISQSDLALVKKEFYRGGSNSLMRSDNKGLGLSIVSRLASLLDLKFTLKSEEGRGTSAVIGGLRVTDALPEPAAPGPRNALPLAGLSVRIADDDPELVEATVRVLSQWGCDVSTTFRPPTDDVTEAVLLTDFDFGDDETLADHLATLEQIRANGTTIAILSGRHPDQIKKELPDFSGLVLTKPLRAAQLRSALMAMRTGEGPK